MLYWKNYLTGIYCKTHTWPGPAQKDGALETDIRLGILQEPHNPYIPTDPEKCGPYSASIVSGFFVHHPGGGRYKIRI
jgi:hypothetical protein